MTYKQENMTFLKGHKNPPTCITLSKDDLFAFTGGKDGCIIKWDLQNQTKTVIKDAHKGQIICIAISFDDKYLATGGKDSKLKIWDAKQLKFLHEFKDHEGHVTSVAFRMGTPQLYSGSTDRQIKIFNVEEMAYVDSLYGHESTVTGIDALFRDTCLSCGDDSSCRLWKVMNETQTIFKGHTNCIECIKMVDENKFITGGQDGRLALWSKGKKKPLSVNCFFF